ncbi:hypothetical protein HIC20_00290 [Buchnera aphidicola (Hormaphis cornu)]|nr:hypothetical protein HIC20_00290 [Buchnera aphidicola (Hormaphis cornu)]
MDGNYTQKNLFSEILQFQPIAHPQGTSIKVLDLFYNIPVRRKYLKTEHAEFIKICETIKKITLSRQDITVIFSHNDKVVKKYFAIQHVVDHVSRLRSLFGKSFVTRLHYLEYNFKQLKLKGWISLRSMKTKGKFLRYYYVNTRIVQSKILNHAVSQAVNEIFGSNELISVILYLQVPFSDIDVNIHPNKREIHFYKFRIIHSFIYQSILHTLNKLVSKTTIKANLHNWTVNNKNTAGINLFSYNQTNSLNHSTCLIDKKK